MHRSLFPLASLFTLIVVAPGCADRSSTGPEQLDPRVLYGFESCDELLGYAKGNAKDIIEEYGNPWGYDEGLDGGGEPVGSTGDPSGGEGGDSGGDPRRTARTAATKAAAARTTPAPTCRRSASTSPTW
jgi:hypothetical protein